MRKSARRRLLVVSLGVLAMMLLSAVSGYSLHAYAASHTSEPPHDAADRDVVTKYFEVVNQGMISGDFSALATVYAPDATLTQSNPQGVTVVAHGITEITAFYQRFQAKFPGIQFTPESRTNLAPHVVLAYEHAGLPTWVKPGRCIHVFTLYDDWIKTADWATFFGGQPA